MEQLHPVLRGLLTFLIAGVTLLNEKIKTPPGAKPYVALAVALVVTYALGLVGVIPQAEVYTQALLLAGFVFSGYTLAKPSEKLSPIALGPAAVAAAAVGGFGVYMGPVAPFWIDPVLAILAGILARLFGGRNRG